MGTYMWSAAFSGVGQRVTRTLTVTKQQRAWDRPRSTGFVEL